MSCHQPITLLTAASHVWMVIIVFVALAEAKAGVSMTHSMNVQGVSLEVYYTH
jgi:hypothetical protein